MTKRRAQLAAMTVAMLARVAAAADVDRTQLDVWVRELADVDPAVRDAARVQLKGIGEGDLPRLHDALAAARPLRPAQVEAVRDVVTYVLTRAAMLRIPVINQAFIGMKWHDRFLGRDDEAIVPDGVAVEETMPGFAAARLFEQGDIVLGFDLPGRLLWITPRLQLTDFGSGRVWVGSHAELTTFVKRLRPGMPLTVLILRSGRPMSIRITLDARPWFEDLVTLGFGPMLETWTINEQGSMLNATATQAATHADERFVAEFGPLLRLDDD